MATIAENLSRIQSAKTDIKEAIEAKGVTVPSSATIDTYATYVSQISSGGGVLTQYVSGTPYCSYDDKVVDVQRQISVDGGTSWINSGNQFTVIVEAGGCVGESIPYGTDMSQYFNQNIERFVIGDTTYGGSGDCFLAIDDNSLVVSNGWVWGSGVFDNLGNIPIDVSFSNPTPLTDWRYNDGTTNPFNDLQIKFSS